MLKQQLKELMKISISMTEMTGWISSRIVQVSDDEAMGIGFFQTKEDYEASEEQFGKIMGVMKDFMAGP